jgi:REP element-mobilizing transposase RayT
VEAECFVGLMRRLEAFSGVEVLTYALMSNHFHLLCYVPPRPAVSEAEILERVEAGYGAACRQALEAQLAQWRQQKAGGEGQVQALLERYRQRMYDLSAFIKELKGGFAQWYNRRQERYGVLWAERFKSVLVEGGEALAAVAAYIELNPVRAGLCRDPKDYRYCGYSEALGRGGRQRQGKLRTILGLPPGSSWSQVLQHYGQYLFVRSQRASGPKAGGFGPAPAPPEERVEEAGEAVAAARRGQILVAEALRGRIRSFSEGLILGSQSFVEKHCQSFTQRLGRGSPRPAKPLGLWEEEGSLWALRQGRTLSRVG